MNMFAFLCLSSRFVDWIIKIIMGGKGQKHAHVVVLRGLRYHIWWIYSTVENNCISLPVYIILLKSVLLWNNLRLHTVVQPHRKMQCPMFGSFRENSFTQFCDTGETYETVIKSKDLNKTKHRKSNNRF